MRDKFWSIIHSVNCRPVSTKANGISIKHVSPVLTFIFMTVKRFIIILMILMVSMIMIMIIRKIMSMGVSTSKSMNIKFILGLCTKGLWLVIFELFPYFFSLWNSFNIDALAEKFALKCYIRMNEWVVLDKREVLIFVLNKKLLGPTM